MWNITREGDIPIMLNQNKRRGKYASKIESNEESKSDKKEEDDVKH